MKKITYITLGSALLMLASCAPKNSIDADAFDGVLDPVLDRHDAYVVADEDLDPAERDTFLISSDLLRAAVEEAKKE